MPRNQGAGIALKPRTGIALKPGAGIALKPRAGIAPIQGPALSQAKGPGIAALAALPIQKMESRRNLFFLRLSAIPCLLTCFSDHMCFRLSRFSSNSYYAGSSNTTHKQQCKPQDGIARISCLRIIRVSCMIRSGSSCCILFP